MASGTSARSFTQLVHHLVADPRFFDWFHDPANANATAGLTKSIGLTPVQHAALKSKSAHEIQNAVIAECGGDPASGPITHVMHSFGP